MTCMLPTEEGLLGFTSLLCSSARSGSHISFSLSFLLWVYFSMYLFQQFHVYYVTCTARGNGLFSIILFHYFITYTNSAYARIQFCLPRFEEQSFVFLSLMNNHVWCRDFQFLAIDWGCICGIWQSCTSFARWTSRQGGWTGPQGWVVCTVACKQLLFTIWILFILEFGSEQKWTKKDYMFLTHNVGHGLQQCCSNSTKLSLLQWPKQRCNFGSQSTYQSRKIRPCLVLRPPAASEALTL